MSLTTTYPKNVSIKQIFVDMIKAVPTDRLDKRLLRLLLKVNGQTNALIDRYRNLSATKFHRSAYGHFEREDLKLLLRVVASFGAEHDQKY